jgi:hypothetical protein
MGPGVGVGSLTPHREPTTVPESPVAPDVHETLYVHGDLGAESPLHLVGPFNLPTEEIDVVVSQILGTTARIHSTGIKDLPGPGVPDPENIGQGHLDALAPRKINTSNTCHQIVSAVLRTRISSLVSNNAGLTLALLVARIPLANDPYNTPATNHLAVLTDRLNA